MSRLETSARLACVDIYQPSQEIFRNLFVIEDTVCGVTIIDNVLYVVNQGTVDLQGWKADLDIKPVLHPVLGYLHNGFFSNTPELVSRISSVVHKDMEVVCCGHSKGAAEASIVAALLKISGVKVSEVYLFACPNVGYEEFSGWMKANVKGVSYKNASTHFSWFSDPVPEVPIHPYVPTYPHSFITEYPRGLGWLFPTNWHSASLYFEAIKKSA